MINISLIENFEAVRDKINKLIIFERDGAKQSIRMSNIAQIMEEHKDPLVLEFFETAAKLGEEVLKTIFTTESIDNLPVEFKDHGKHAELIFGDRGLFETTYDLFENIFHGDIVREVSQGNDRAMENLLRELKRHNQ